MGEGDLIPMGPCPFFAWVGAAKKVARSFPTPADATNFWTSQLLGLIDYDFDANSRWTEAVNQVARSATQVIGPLRGAAWAGLLTLDQQLFNRSMQMKWVRARQSCFTVGPTQIPAAKFAAAAYIDCAALAPFAYQSEEERGPSRKAMFVLVLMANMHDLLFDRGCSSRINW